LDYRELTPADLAEASQLVWNVFAEFVAPEYAEEGVETFRMYSAGSIPTTSPEN